MRNILMIGAFPEDPTHIQGGVQASVYGLAKTLLVSGDKVKVIALPARASEHSDKRSAMVEGMEVDYLQFKKFLALGIIHLPFLMEEINRDKNRVVHIHGTGLVQCVLLAILRTKRIKSIWTLHGITAKETWQCYFRKKTLANLTRHWFYRTLEQICIKTAMQITVDTPYVAEEIGKRDNVHIIPQGIFREEFARKDVQRVDNLVISVGVFSPRKAHHHLLEAFAKVKEKVPNARLIIAGALTKQTYYDRLREQVIKAGLSEQVMLLPDLPRNAIIDLYLKAKIFALHSREESQGIALCEAFAAGLPVVATRVGGIPHIANDRKDSLLVQYGDITGFANHITSLLNDGALFDTMSSDARKTGESFDWKNIYGKVVNLYAA